MECTLFFMSVCVHVDVYLCVCLQLYVRGVNPFILVFQEGVRVCVFLPSPQGLFQLRAKNTEKL